MKKLIITGIVVLTASIAFNAFSSEAVTEKVYQNAYFDVATGHKYIKNSDSSYIEYSKNGTVLRKNTPCDLPLLARNKYVIEISPETWILYEKFSGQTCEHKLMPSLSPHPEGWRSKGIFVLREPVKQTPKKGLGYSSKPGNLRYDDQQLIAEGRVYFDIATSHRYIKNSDGTYTEYSKKGVLLNSDVPNTSRLLTSGKYIMDVSAKDYILYEKMDNGMKVQRLLEATSRHPDGWYCKELYASVQ